MKRSSNAAKDLAALLADASPDVRAANAHAAGMLTEAALTSIAEFPTLRPVGVPGRDEQAVYFLELPLPVSANRYWRNYRGRTVVSAEAKDYKMAVCLQAQHRGVRPFAGPVAVYLRVYRARKSGDLDNSIKVLLDALCGVAYADDKQIVELHSWRFDDPRNPRVEVEVRQVEVAHD